MNIPQAIKYFLITMQSVITGKSVVTFFGTSYIVSGNIVKRFGE